MFLFLFHVVYHQAIHPRSVSHLHECKLRIRWLYHLPIRLLVVKSIQSFCSLTIIDITINVEEFSSSACYVISPLTFVASTVRPYLDTISMTFSVLHLSFVYCAIREDDFISEF